MATININGELRLDQTAGIQVEDDNVEVVNNAGVLEGDLDQDFLDYLNGLTLSDAQLDFAALVEGASDPDLVTVTVAPNENVARLFFSDANGLDFDGTLVPDVTTIDGESLFFYSALNSRVVYAATAGGEVAAVFYIESNNDDNTAATVQSITFMAMTHPDANDPDDTIDFSDVLRVSAVVTQGIGDDILVDDDAPSIVVTSDGVQLTVDETVLATDDTQSFAGEFDPDFGTDGAGDTGGIDYTLEATAGPSGLVDTATGDDVILSVDNGVVEGRTETDGLLVFTVSTDDDGNVTLNQERAVVHGDADDPNDTETLAADELVRLVASITDADGDGDSATLNIGQNLNFLDDAPTIDPADAEINLTVDESTQGVDADADFSNQFSHDFGEDGEGDITFALDVVAGASGLVDSVSGENVILSVLGGVVEGRTENGGDLVFTASVDADGNVSLDQSRGVMHTPDSGPNQQTTLSDDTLVTLTATITDGDDDQDTAVLDIGTNLVFEDDAPVIEVEPTAAILDNNVDPPTGGGDFAYDIGADGHDAAFYTGGGSDFINMALSGSIGDPPGTAIVNPDIDLVSENSLSATFSFSFDYDADPITVGNPLTHATGTLVIDKDDDNYTVTLDDPIEGFSFSVLHTNELLRKAPPGNTGHPELVVTELADEAPAPLGDGFYVQFTSNSTNQANPTFGFNGTGDGAPVAGDTTFNAGQFVTNNHEDWVSATQSTNGVAGDTIQKGELLTLRFFAENILGDVNPNAPGGGTEKVDPTTTANGVAIKFDGIGNSEDLVVILDLIDDQGTADTSDDVQTTRSIVVQNSDLIKGVVPSPYNTEFSLDNNDALLVMESNDYNAAGENFEIQGIQIMQSANGLSGSGINLNGAVDNPLTENVIEGASPVNGPLVAWDPTDNDVLKIVDIGFIQSTTGTTDAHLDFAFNVVDADGDMTDTQHIVADILNDVDALSFASFAGEEFKDDTTDDLPVDSHPGNGPSVPPGQMTKYDYVSDYLFA